MPPDCVQKVIPIWQTQPLALPHPSIYLCLSSISVTLIQGFGATALELLDTEDDKH